MNNQSTPVNVYSSELFTWKGSNGSAFLTDVFGRERVPFMFTIKSKRTGASVTYEYSHKTNSDPCEVVFKGKMPDRCYEPSEIRFLNT